MRTKGRPRYRALFNLFAQCLAGAQNGLFSEAVALMISCYPGIFAGEFDNGGVNVVAARFRALETTSRR